MDTKSTVTELTIDDGIEILLRGYQIQDFKFPEINQFNKFCQELDIEPLSTQNPWSKQYNIPEKYATIDVRKYVYSLIPNAKKDYNKITSRVELELELFESRGLFPTLQLLIFIVDVMKEKNIVQGVGRGSSVASYVLYLIGVHQIDSIKYNLPINELLK